MVEHGRARPDWLALREPADAAARADDLVAEVRAVLPRDGVAVVHDLGCGTGSMARWLAVRLDGPQHWVLVDRDAELLDLAARTAPTSAGDGSPVTVETRRGDVTRITADELGQPDLVTASALLDMFTGEELARFVATCLAAGCPALITLSVTGVVDLEPSDPFDRRVAEAFYAHQRRVVDGRPLLGPGAVGAAIASFERLGAQVVARSSPWHLGAGQAELLDRWFEGWLGAAYEQSPALAAESVGYADRRRAEAARGGLGVTVQHQDLWVRPGPGARGRARPRSGRTAHT